VSRGGIFIKTSSPFPPGTLLKFEIRIQDEQTVLGGVGRVVWKRDADQTADDSPQGMGVKFIKIDDKSKGLIARLVDAQKGGPSAYDLGKPADAAADDDGESVGTGNSQPPPAATPAAAKPARASTMLGPPPRSLRPLAVTPAVAASSLRPIRAARCLRPKSAP
jgi:uncharacterized protein (TIGR02266 family)